MLDSNHHRATGILPERQLTRFNKIIGILVGSCLALAFLFYIFPMHALAHTAKGGPTLQVNAGFETRYRDGNWVPVQIALRNNGPDFSGTLSVSPSTSTYLEAGIPNTSSSYQEPITLANGAQKQVTIYMPLYFGTQNITVKLLDSSGNIVSSETGTLSPLSPADVLVGVLSDQTSGFASLNATSLPNQRGFVIVEFLNASTMPTMAEVLKNFNLIVLDNFTTSNLSAAQLTALQTWVNQGGAFIVVGGPEWHRTLATLPAGLLPVTVNGTTTLPAGIHFLPAGGPKTGRPGQSRVSDTVRSPVTVSTATTTVQGDPYTSEIVLASGTTPLIAQAREGQGIVCYLAFDPTLDPIIGWPGASALWKGLLLRTLGDQLLLNINSYPARGYYSGQGSSPLAGSISGLLQSLLPNTIPSPWTIAILLVGYLLILGPVRLLLVRRLKRRDWSWRIVLSSIIIFSFLSYGLALQEKGTSILTNSISIAQLSPGRSSTHITTYLGVFVPNQGDFLVHIPGNGLVQPSPDNYSYYQAAPTGEPHSTVVPGSNGTDVNLQAVNVWTLHSILSEQDRQIHGGLISHLTLQNGVLVGTVTNTFNYALGDAYVLMPNNVFNLGYLAAGQTKQVNLSLSTATPNAGMTLADQIAGSPYPYSPGSSLQTERQRHLAILLALEGKGYGYSCKGPCNVPIVPLQPPYLIPVFGNAINVTSSSVVISSSTSFAPLSGGPFIPRTGDNDPLLVPGSPATLIGWAEKPLDSTNDVTINSLNSTGLHETLVQAPLSVNLSGTLNLPPSFIAGHLIDVQGNNVQIQFPGVYTMSTGSVTFEFTLPNNASLSGLTITEPSNIYLSGQGGVSTPGNTVPLRLYNWHTNSWDSVSLNQYSFTTTDIGAYIGPGGHVLVQLVNQDTSLGTVIFSKPSLNLQGVAPGS